ncbi:pyridoxal phosphate-dependent decarboxylase family protein [Stieleria varia]|uniref:L-2,4-diaminobutyrate decarboxylase n=1 Tax=Stieleria varia TaxID=2528005 RepID=A0A5C6A0G4_9BACT|nr:pyridoxal-dependent decarboxylase [Stieleria varia]TWT93314.1 L-2,4-diaminobutyrate decarboxylase [Stieleria varia]
MPPDPILTHAYDPERFRASAHQLVDLLADELAANLSATQSQSLPWQTPQQSEAFWRDLATQAPSIMDIARTVLQRSVRISDPRFIGHQICTPIPDAILAGFLTDFVNNGSGVYEMGMAGVAMERWIMDQVAQRLDLPETAAGVMTSGGTLGNLTALLCARSVKSPTDVWKSGTSGQLAIMVSEQSHYCVRRAAGIMGWGESGIITVPCNDRFSMSTDQLPELYQQATGRGITVIGVVGSACGTSTGAFDDLNAIASFCRHHDLWFHVDGAHGAALAFSDVHKGKLAGIEHADSVVIDFHKMLMTPVLASAVLFRRGLDGFRTFCQQADYLFAESNDANWDDLAQRTFECTKTMMAVKFYTVLAGGGPGLLAANVDRLMAMTGELVREIQRRPAFELAVQPQCNIVCFRHRHRSAIDLNDWNNRLRQRIIHRGEYYLVQTKLHGQTWLRCTVTNPMTGPKEFVGMLDQIEQIATQID